MFFMSHAGYARNFESTLRELLDRDHEVACVLERSKTRDPAENAILDRLGGQYPRLSYCVAPNRANARLATLTRRMRLLIDYVRYLEPRYTKAAKLRQRAAERVPSTVRRALALPGIRSARSIAALLGLLRRVERFLPVDAAVVSFVRTARPDLVLVTPLVELGSPQGDYVRAARRIGIPSVLCAFSWDNLTNKGLLRDVPDLVTVWNGAQKAEAVELHGVPSERVVVTGAVAYDHWFDWRPSRDRATFCEDVGLPQERPIVLYLGSSPWIGPGEDQFVRRWLAALREAGGPVASAAVAVRPHPLAGAEWRRLDLADLGPAAVFPREGVNPTYDEARRDYFDTLYFSDAVVGLNTSAQIESAIVSKPVFTVVLPEYRDTQEGTLHFHHLVEEGGGLLHVASSLGEHADQLNAALRDGAVDDRSRQFLETFVRPHGIDVPATPLLVDALERRAQMPAAPPKRGFAERAAESLFDRLRASTMLEGVASDSRTRTRRPVEDPIALAVAAVEAVVSTGAPVIAGPWTSEVGYELLYWIPFLRWAVDRWPELAEKLAVVSRGGVASWYDGVSARYVDVLDVLSPEDWVAERARERERAGGKQKQLDLSRLEEEVLAEAACRLKLDSPVTLHPAIVYRLYKSLWRADDVMRFLEISRYAKIEGGGELPNEVSMLLPERYVAARFYFSEAFPPTAANREAVESVLARFETDARLVVLTMRNSLDDHVDLVPSTGSVIVIDELSSPRENLALQTQIIGNASAFVGTYGGLSYLAPLLGVPTLAVYSDDRGFHRCHLELAQRVFTPPLGDLLAVGLRQLDLLRLTDRVDAESARLGSASQG
jgi:hypothetical protein